MKKNKRNFIELFTLASISFVLLPYKLLYTATKKIINPNLTEKQKRLC